MIHHILLIAFVTVFSSMIGTITGFGLSTIMIPVMLLFYPIKITLLFVGIIHWWGDIWKLILFKKGADWKLILAFGIPGIIMSYVGASLFIAVDSLILKKLLGGFLLVYMVYLFVQKTWQVKTNMVSGLIGGSLSGFFAGIFGVGGAIRSAFLAAYNLPKEVYLFTGAMIALCIDTARIIRYVSGGIILDSTQSILVLCLIPVSLIGAYGAKKILSFVPQERFRLIIAVFLGLIGLKYLFMG
ncbi:MAG: TSUP family transporter [Elusimicrobia bacterium]|nr:TSUP family transporter [Elusimicrobiota bacterium]